MEQPNEATAQAEVDRPAVRYDTIVALQGQGHDDINGSLQELDLLVVDQHCSVFSTQRAKFCKEKKILCLKDRHLKPGSMKQV